MENKDKKGWEKEFEERFVFVDSGPDGDGFDAELPCWEQYHKQKDDYDQIESIKAFIRQVEQDAYLMGQAEAHKAVDGYCCACEWDILTMKDKIKEAKIKAYEKGYKIGLADGIE
jgi:hypothetical protein